MNNIENLLGELKELRIKTQEMRLTACEKVKQIEDELNETLNPLMTRMDEVENELGQHTQKLIDSGAFEKEKTRIYNGGLAIQIRHSSKWVIPDERKSIDLLKQANHMEVIKVKEVIDKRGLDKLGLDQDSLAALGLSKEVHVGVKYITEVDGNPSNKGVN